MSDRVFEHVAFNTTADSYLPHWQPAYSIEEPVERIAGNGYDAVELAACRPHALPEATSERERGALVELVQDASLTITSVFSHLPPLGLNLGALVDGGYTIGGY